MLLVAASSKAALRPFQGLIGAITALFPEDGVDVAYYVDLAPLVLLRHHLPTMYIHIYI